MSESEFENYLTLIGRLLRLNSAQRVAIGEELRDHFESRLAELINSGFSHDQAVKLALEEFGDAAGLAAQFSNITRTRNRRLIMRCTLASVVGLAAAVFVALAIWPDSRAPQFTGRAVADPAEKPNTEAGQANFDAAQANFDKLIKAAEEVSDDFNSKTEATLNKIASVDFQSTPLNEALALLCTKYQFQAIFDTAAMRDAGLDPNTLQFNLTLHDVRLKTALKLILEQFNLSYILRDGVLLVTTKDKAGTTLRTHVYDCQNLLAADDHRLYRRPFANKKPAGIGGGIGPGAPVAGAQGPVMGGGGGGIGVFSGASPGIVDAGVAGGPAFDPITGQPVDGASAGNSNPNSPAEDLIALITSSVDPSSWSEEGGPATIQEYNGLLIVNQTDEVQSEVAGLLSQISSKLAARAHTH